MNRSIFSRLGVRGRLFLLSLLLIAVVGVPSGAFLEHQLRTWLENRIERELVHQAKLSATWAAESKARASEHFDRLADRIGEASEIRITYIGPTGMVLGDSSLSPRELETLDNHNDRPEIVEARKQGFGKSRRLSVTLEQQMLYIAVPAQLHPGAAVVRASVPLADVDSILNRFRFMMSAAGLVGLLVALGMTFWASHLIARPVQQLVDRSRPLVHAATEGVDDPSEIFEPVPGSVVAMAREVEKTMALLAKERNRFQTVLQGMQEAVLAINADDRITLVNPATLQLLGIDHEPLGQKITEAFETSDLSDLAARGRQEPSQAELSFGENLVLAQATPLVSSRGVVIVMHDVTEMRRLETIRKDFVANVSHELRTPVSIVRANSETLLDGAIDDPKRSRGFVEAIFRHSERLSNIIADLLDLSRIEAGRYQLQMRRLRPQDMVARNIEAVKQKAEQRKVTVTSEVVSTTDVRADPKALDQVLMNLLDNAIKYAPESGCVHVHVVDDDHRVRFSVEDNGQGIGPEQRKRIFERFYRVDPGRSRDMGGTGLGLAIVKHLVESMRGQVGVDAAQPHGSVFWFSLPKFMAQTRDLSEPPRAA